MFEATIPQFIKTLNNLSGILSKTAHYAEEHKLDLNFLLNDRLIANQFNFTRQVQIACDNAKGSAARLSGKEAPKFEDNETTVAQLEARIAKTIEYLKTFSADDFKGWENRQIVLPYFPGKYQLGYTYLYEYALPNFYFHVTTAYSIMRHNGIPLGKNDYLGKLSFKDL